MIRSDKQIIKYINYHLKKNKKNAICYDPRAGKNKSGHNLVRIKCLDTGKVSRPFIEQGIVLGYSPFTKKRSRAFIKNLVNGYLKKYKRNAICINPQAGRDGSNQNLVIIKCLETNRISKPYRETCIKKGIWPFKRSNGEIIKKINFYCQKHKWNAICINPNAGRYRSANLVQIKCLKTGMISKPIRENSIKNGRYPFINPDPIKLIEFVNCFLKKYKKNAIFHKKLLKRNSQGEVLFTIKCLNLNKISLPISRKQLKNGAWPFKKTKEDIKKEINFYCKKNKWKAKYHNHKKTKNGTLFQIKDTVSGKLSNYRHLFTIKKGRWPFGTPKSKRTPEYIRKNLNQILKKNKINAICINPRAGITKYGNNLVILKCLETGKLSNPILENNIKLGQNPFNKSQDRVEINKLHPKYARLFKKLNIKFLKNFKIGKGFIDFVIILKNQKYGIEIKRSDKWWHSSNKQINYYKKIGKLKQYNLKKIILTDPNGKHKRNNSISIKDLENFIKKNNH